MAILLLDLDHPNDNANADSSLFERACNYAQKIIHHVASLLNVQIRIGLGRVKKMHKWIADSTEEAFLSIRHKTYLPKYEHVELYAYQATTSHTMNNPTVRIVDFFQQLSEGIRTSNCRKIKQILEQYLLQLEQKADTKPTSLQRSAREIWHIFEYASLREIGIVLEKQHPIQKIEAEISEIFHIDQLRTWLNDKIDCILDNRLWYENIRHKQAVEFLIDYIHEHYAEDITLLELSEKVHLSRNYLSEIFKKATGDTFNDYLTRVRMEKARSLLWEGKYLIYEVAEKVGYKNVPYFSHLFKKYTGHSPSELLKNHK